jgi:hypothetical protein
MNKALGVLALIAGMLAGGAHADGKKLSGEEIQALLAGNTVKASDYVEFYDASGALRGAEKGGTYAGSWRIEGDKVCIAVPAYKYDECLTIRKEGEKYAFVGKKKTVKVEVSSGNAEDL